MSILEGKQVLIVDDNVHMLRILHAVLRAYGCSQIVEATDPAGAFEIFRARTIDLVLTDYRMAVLDGFEFVRLIRTAKDIPNPHVPIVMVTAYSERSRVKQAVDAGVNTFVRKPFTAKDLFLHIAFALNDQRDFVERNNFVGPSRRTGRTPNPPYKGAERRRPNKVEV